MIRISNDCFNEYIHMIKKEPVNEGTKSIFIGQTKQDFCARQKVVYNHLQDIMDRLKSIFGGLYCKYYESGTILGYGLIKYEIEACGLEHPLITKEDIINEELLYLISSEMFNDGGLNNRIRMLNSKDKNYFELATLYLGSKELSKSKGIFLGADRIYNLYDQAFARVTSKHRQ